MRKIVFGIMIIFFNILFVGCDFAENTDSEYAMESMVVEYDYTYEIRRLIEIDFLTQEKTVTDFFDEEKRVEKSAYDRGNELLDYLKKSVLFNLSEKSADVENRSEERIIWSIKIITSDGRIMKSGIESEGFPDYWEELLTYINLE